MNAHPIAHHNICQHTIRPNCDIVAQCDFALKNGIDVNCYPLATNKLAAYINSVGVCYRNTASHQAFGLSTLKLTLHLVELHPVIYSENFQFRNSHHRTDALARGDSQRQDIRQIVLALTVLVFYHGQKLRQIRGRCCQHTGINFADLTLRLSGILLFYHSQK